MPIKNKDGTEYKLNRPNPLVMHQSWFTNVIYHNFDKFSEIITVEDEIEELPTPVPTIVKPEPKKEEKPKQEPKMNTPKNVLIIHCLPVVLTEKKDDLYNEIHTFVSYGNKFIIECMPMEISDFEFKFWTKTQLEKKTVIYPKTYKDGSKFGDFRWWKVNETIPQSGGQITSCIISDFHPDFSD